MASADFDVVIIGAGVSGINMAQRLQSQCPGLTYTILESREHIGGTWDLFRYPGIRSDSDLHTFGFTWRPWNSPSPIAEAHLIREYLQESAEEFDIYPNIQFSTLVKDLKFSSESRTWSVETSSSKDPEASPRTVRARFVSMCTGYYDYKTPLQVNIPGIKKFEGQTIHPQFWPEGLDLTGKRVVIIGSGATAITLLPSIAKQAEEVVMLQRSPSYVVSQPQNDTVANVLRRILPATWMSTFLRVKFLVLPYLFFRFCKAFPEFAKKMLMKGTQKAIPKGWKVDPTFNPRYYPWDQRLCLCPDGDFFEALHQGNVKVITDTIEEVTEKSIVLTKHEKLVPDIIVTATGLKMLVAGGIRIVVDGKEVDLSQQHAWNSTLMEGCPNMSFCFGYTNASWTLGADCAALLTTRVINKLQETGKDSMVVPVLPKDADFVSQPLMELSSTYIQAAKHKLPRTGSTGVWRPRVSYFTDYRRSLYGTITDGLVYS